MKKKMLALLALIVLCVGLMPGVASAKPDLVKVLCNVCDTEYAPKDAAKHKLLECGDHYKCKITGADKPHTTLLGCGDHYECELPEGAQKEPEKRKHNEKAACGTHYKCVGGEHGAAACGHYACAEGEHALLACGHYACAGGDHGAAVCGNHYVCAGGNHEEAACGHYACAEGEHALLACGHYACAEGDHGAAVCGNHYVCAGGNHEEAACGHYACAEGEHGAADCGNDGHYECEGDHGECEVCRKPLCNGENHGEAACGTDGHYKCDGENHGTCGDCNKPLCEGEHGKCEACKNPLCVGEHDECEVCKNPLCVGEHEEAACKTKGHYACDGKEHGVAPCGDNKHLICAKDYSAEKHAKCPYCDRSLCKGDHKKCGYTISVKVDDAKQGTAKIGLAADPKKSDPVTAKAGDVVYLKAEAKPGYEFVNWEIVQPTTRAAEGTLDNASDPNTTYTVGNAAVTIKANFKAKAPQSQEYVLKFHCREQENAYWADGDTDDWKEITVKAGSVLTEADWPEIKRDGYHFVGWEYGPRDNKVELAKSFTVNANIDHLDAIWEEGDSEPEDPEIYDVTVEVEGSGIASADLARGETGTLVTLTATPATGYVFKGWQVVSGGVNVADNKFEIGTEDVVVKAIFEEEKPETYDVTVEIEGSGTASADLARGETGTLVTLTATPSEGYEFSKWEVVSGGVSVADNKFEIGTADVVVKAIFTKKAAEHQHNHEWVNTNPNEHWQQCNGCTDQVNRGEHVYDNDKDLVCDTCGYTRNAPVKIAQVIVDVDGTFTSYQPEVGSEFAQPADPVKKGYIFTGWTDEKGNAVSFPLTVPEGTTVLIAQFEPMPSLPQTGDNSMLGLWVSMMGMAGAALLLLRKRAHN